MQLKELFFPLVSVKALVPKDNKNAHQNFVLDDLKIDFNFEIETKENVACAALHIKTIDVNKREHELYYEFDIEVFATYDIVSPEYKDEKALYLRKFAAASALIGAAREQVSLMTARGPWGTSYLPMITIDQLMEKPEIKDKTETTSEDTKKKKSRVKKDALQTK